MKVTLFLVTVANWFSFGETSNVNQCLVAAAALEQRFGVQTVCLAQTTNHVEIFEVAKMMKIDGFDDAILGVCQRKGQPDCVLYDEEKILTMLMRDGASYGDALDYYRYNILDAYVGDGTPAFLVEASAEEIEELGELE